MGTDRDAEAEAAAAASAAAAVAAPVVISSPATLLWKWSFPLAACAFVAWLLATGEIGRTPRSLAGPALIVAVGLVFFLALDWNLADRVVDAGDHLLVVRRGREARIALGELVGARVSWTARPKRLVLELAARAAPFGREVVFVPRSALWGPVPSAAELGRALLRRADAARAALP